MPIGNFYFILLKKRIRINDQQQARLKALGFCSDARLTTKTLPAHPAFSMAVMI